MSKKSYETLSGDITKVTMKAILFFGDWGQEVWIPLSVIEDGEDLEEEDNADIHVETWWLKKEGLL